MDDVVVEYMCGCPQDPYNCNPAVYLHLLIWGYLFGLVGLLEVLQFCVIFAEVVDVLLILPRDLDIALLVFFFELLVQDEMGCFGIVWLIEY